jgi:hypothetical protein
MGVVLHSFVLGEQLRVCQVTADARERKTTNIHLS